MADYKFNVNQQVKVKITEFGHSILAARRDDLNAGLIKRGYPPYPSYEPREDADGYTSMQLHDVMNTFGPYLSNGRKVPFQMDILLPGSHLIRQRQ